MHALRTFRAALVTALVGAGLAVLLLVVFVESGLLVGFFLPGDSLLFTAGLLINTQDVLPLWLVLLTVPLAAIAASIRERTGGVVVITDGVHGAVGYDGAPPMRARLWHPVGQYPVGSGDSFLGGLVTALDAGAPLEQAMRLATACGTANALVPGAARFERGTAEALVAEVELVH